LTGSVLGRHKSAARQLGLTLEEYERHIEADEAWCYQCRRWRHVARFRRRSSLSANVHAQCDDCHRTYMRTYMRRRYAAQRAARAAEQQVSS
jgi:hypothetical protein